MTISEKLQKIAENEPRVFAAGKNMGYSEGFNVGYDEGHTQGFDEGQAQGSAEGWQQGLDEGVVIGREQQYDDFWDAFQQNGSRTHYTYGFAGRGWTVANLIPKYKNIQPTTCTGMFFNNTITDLVSHFENHGITLDFSKSTSVYDAFSSTSTKRLPSLNISSAGSALTMFAYNSSLEEIAGLECGVNNTFSSTFAGCSALVKVIFSGTIANNISLSDSKNLSKESITSLINTLSSSSSVIGKSVTLSETAVNAIDWSNTVINNVTYNTFDAVANTKPNWTISLM